jgi:hypothetical protein
MGVVIGRSPSPGGKGERLGRRAVALTQFPRVRRGRKTAGSRSHLRPTGLTFMKNPASSGLPPGAGGRGRKVLWTDYARSRAHERARRSAS